MFSYASIIDCAHFSKYIGSFSKGSEMYILTEDGVNVIDLKTSQRIRSYVGKWSLDSTLILSYYQVIVVDSLQGRVHGYENKEDGRLVWVVDIPKVKSSFAGRTNTFIFVYHKDFRSHFVTVIRSSDGCFLRSMNLNAGDILSGRDTLYIVNQITGLGKVYHEGVP